MTDHRLPTLTTGLGDYAQQLDEKITTLKSRLHALGEQATACNIAVFESDPSHYRLRAEFKFWHEGEQSHYAMSDSLTKEPIFVEQFPVACQAINDLMPRLKEAICANATLRKKCFQIEFLSTLKGETLVTLIYHKPLNQDWVDAIAPVKSALGIQIIGRSRKQKIVLDRDYVTECLQVKGKEFLYRQIEGGFTQPNGRVCEKMLTWAVDNSSSFGGDLLELYCGNGNFTLPLAQNFQRVMATEIAKTSVNAAQHNITLNNIKNITIARMSSEEFVEAMDGVRAFRRLKDIDLTAYQFTTIFVDPPRAGLDAQTLTMLKRFDNIIYISCNPETLIDNLKTLCQTHQIKKLAAFDQFPYTHHLEAGVILSKK